jgi:hypothetical protein
MVVRNCPGEFVASQVMVFVGPFGGFGNLIGKSGGGENLR